jgi:pimeloyl-ACP methyl ester carboxylesterase
MPIKVIVGEYDAAINEATFVEWFNHCELEVIPNAGHYPMNETPIALAA